MTLKASYRVKIYNMIESLPTPIPANTKLYEKWIYFFRIIINCILEKLGFLCKNGVIFDIMTATWPRNIWRIHAEHCNEKMTQSLRDIPYLVLELQKNYWSWCDIHSSFFLANRAIGIANVKKLNESYHKNILP